MDEILNSKNINSIRFRMAKPQGYFTEDVDNFIDDAIKKSIAAYEVKISEQENLINRLESQIAPLEAKVSELEIKANFAEAGGSAQQDEALIQSMAKQEELEQQILALKSELGEKQDYITQLNSYIDEVEPLIAAGAAALASETAVEEEIATVEEPEVEEELTPVDLGEDEFEAYDEEDAEKEIEEEQDNNLQYDEPVEIVEEITPEDLEEEKIVDVYSNLTDEYEVDPEELEKAMRGETVVESPEISKNNGSVADSFGVKNKPYILPEGIELPEGVRPEDL